MNAQEYNLNIRPGYGYSQTVKVSQDDIGRPLEFHLYDGMDMLAITTGTVITIHATKPSGLGFTETCTWSGSTASISTTESMTQESGAFPAELVITSSGDVLGTANFTFCVERSPHQTGTTDGVAEDLQDIYEQLDDLKEDIENISGISDDVKLALLDCFAHVAWTDEHGQDYYDALEEALYAEEPKTLVSISADYTQSGTVYDTDTLDSLKADLVVTATYDDSSTETVTTYTLSGTLEEGTSTITVSYGGKTTTFNVTVTAWIYPMTLTNASDGAGFGSYDATKNTNTPPYVANTNTTRIHFMGTDATGYPVQYGKRYKVSVASGAIAYAIGFFTFNEDGLAQINNVASIDAVNRADSGWLTLSSGEYTFTPQTINDKEPVCMWFSFKKDSSGTGRWDAVSDITPLIIEELD